MEDESRRRRGKSIYSDFVEEFCKRTGRDISNIVTKKCGDVSELCGQAFDVVWIDELVGHNGKALKDIQITALTTGNVCFIIQPGSVHTKKDLCSIRSGMEIQEVSLYDGEGDGEKKDSGR